LGRKHLGSRRHDCVLHHPRPNLGFVGKFYLFSGDRSGYIGLALIACSSLVSAYYYLRVVVYMFIAMATRSCAAPGEPDRRGAAIGLVALTIFATPLFNWAASAILAVIDTLIQSKNDPADRPF
jgi:NADH:ubiquinone oxidoreductase subunit 2 (subunit N)